MDCGNITRSSLHKTTLDYLVVRFSDIYDKIIPFFQKHRVIGEKSKDFSDFCRVAELMKTQTHLTLEGLDQGGHAATYSSPFPPYPPSLLPSRRRVTEGLGKTMGWGPVVSPGILIVDRRTADLRASPQSSFGVKDTKLS